MSRGDRAPPAPSGAALLIVLVVAGPLALGGVHAPVLATLLALALVTAWSWLPRTGPRAEIPWLVVLLATLAVLTALQLVPLPRGLLETLSPASAGLLASSVDLLVPGAASRASLAAPETAVSLGRTVLVGLALWAAFLATRRSDSTDTVRRAALGALLAVLVVVVAHAVLGSERIYGVLPPRGRGISAVQGPFVNCNHLGSFLCLLTPVALAEALRARSRRGATLALLLAGLTVTVAVATLSRGAFLGLAVGGTAFVALERRRLLARIGLAPAVAMAVGAVGLSTLVAEALTGGRLGRLLAPGTLLDGSDKLRIWRMGVEILGDHPLLGVGRGGFASVHLAYRTGPYESQAAFVENGYLQLLVDLGIPLGIGLLAAGALLLGWMSIRVVRGGRRDPFASGALAGLLALAVHEAADFSLVVPGVAAPAAVLVGALLARTAAAGPTLSVTPARIIVAVGALIALAAVAWGGPRCLRPSDARLQVLLLQDDAPSVQALELAALHPADPWGWVRIGGALAVKDPAGALPFAGLAMRLDPMGAEPHRVAALALLNLGRDDQALLEMKLAIARATWDLPDLVEGVVERWPDAEDRLRVLPDDRSQAVRVIRLLGDLAGPELASVAWARVQERSPEVAL